MNKQDFNNSIYQDIDMIRGDTLSFNFILTGTGGEMPEFVFSCAEEYSNTPLFIATNTDGVSLVRYDEIIDEALFNVRIDPEKTKNLDLTTYFYDLQMTFNEDIITLMRGHLKLLYDVTIGG